MNAKSSGYYFYINTGKQGDFQIWISVPLNSVKNIVLGCIMLTITCCVQQRLFVKRKKLRNTVIKQGSENRININFDAHDLLSLTVAIYSTADFLCGYVDA